MAKRRYYEWKNAEEVFFLSRDENTLPSVETLLEEIEKCIPQNYDIIRHEASRNRSFVDNVKIHYDVNKVDPNRYKIRVCYTISPKLLGYAIVLGCLLIGGLLGYAIGEHFYKEKGGALGAILGFILASYLIPENHSEPEQVCDKIINGIKEYERAHLMGITQ